MAITNLLEEPFVLSLSSSPRISISNNFSTSSPTTLESSHPLHPSSSFSDFDFKFSFVLSSLDPSPADELFSSGFLLPIPLKSSSSTSTITANPPPPAPPPSPLPQLSNTSSCINPNPFTHFHRSFSLNCSRAKAKLSKILPFPLSRSYSTGSNSFSKQRLNRPNPQTFFPGDDGYVEGRISSRHGGVFRFLLCSCWSKDGSKGNRGWL